MYLIIRTIILITLAFSGLSYAQDNTQSSNVAISIPEIAILDIENENTTDINFNLNADGLEGGKIFKVRKNNASLWLNYTSVVSESGNQRSISVQAENLPTIDGMVVKVQALPFREGFGGGDLGTPTGTITPNEVPTELVTNIGSAYTGNGQRKGHRLRYKLRFNGDFADLNVEDAASTITMTYTITD
jgi:hypothetical protein